MTPAEYLLRPDEQENVAHIGSAPRRGISQMRIHYLMDLPILLGFQPDASKPSGYSLQVSWSLLDFGMDFLVANQLGVGFEFMGSPVGFPQLPQSFWAPWDGNGSIDPNTTLALWRQLVSDTVQRYVGRYGPQEVQTWRFSAWNEPDSGWGWPKQPNASVVDTYLLYYDATTAGLEDAEAALAAQGKAVRPTFCGSDSGGGAHDPHYLPGLLTHYVTGRNAWTGAPVRLDYIAIHAKGGSTSYGVAYGEMATSALIRGNPLWAGSNLTRLAVSNEEGDPMVGWQAPEAWRADARYPSIMPKVINQHLLGIADNSTVTLNNPLGLLSFDAGFMNGDGHSGFDQRTLTARFNNGSAFGTVRKSGLSAFGLLSKLGDTRVSYSGVPAAGGAVFTSNVGIIPTLRASDPASGSAQASIVVYNSADCTDATGPAVQLGLNLTGLPFAPGQSSVLAVHWRLDNSNGHPGGVWAGMNSPAVPSPAQLAQLWSSSRPQILSSTPLTVGQAGSASVAPFTLPLPGFSLLHIAAKPAGPPPTPEGLVAFVKPSALSLLSAAQAEVLLRWQCDAPTGASASGAPSLLVASHLVQTASSAAGPWADVSVPTDFFCALPLAMPTSGATAWYRVAAVDYWGAASEWSQPAQAGPWPTGP